MSQPKNISCLVCGGKDFTIAAGSYFCLECNTQSQDIREEVFDEYIGTQKVSSRVLHKAKPKSIDGSERLTSWEVLNYLLKGITDELMELGASAELRIVTLQLWATYLKRLEVAFTSVDVERKPRLGYVFKSSDAEIVYGVTRKQLKARSWRSRSSVKSVSEGDMTEEASASDTEADATSASADDIEASRRSMQRKLANQKRALASAEYSQMSQQLSASMSRNQTLEDLDSSADTQTTPKRLKITRHTRSLLSSLLSSTDDEERSAKKRIAQTERKSWRTVTAAKVAAVACIALAITKQEILLSDFIRWVEEGHVSLGTGCKFLPSHVRVDSCTRRMLEVNALSYNKMRLLMRALCNELDIGELPPPDRTRLVERYCLELQLPADIQNMAKRLVHLSSNRMRPNTPRLVEAQTMAAIVVTLKLLFSLDDSTEYKLSDTASALNRASSMEGSPTNLFVWNDWIQFIECRKAVVSSVHWPTRINVMGRAATRDTRLFIQHYQRVTAALPQASERNPKYALNKDFVATLTHCLQQLSAESGGAEVEGVKLPASLTPLHTYTQTLLSRYPELVRPARKILEQDFTATSAQYMINPERFVTLGLSYDLNIILRGTPPAIFQQGAQLPKESEAIPKVGINRSLVKVQVVKKIKRKTESIQTVSSSPLKRLMEEIDELVSNDSDDDEWLNGKVKEEQREVPTCAPTVFDLYKTGSQYWFIHRTHHNCNESNDDFEQFAMRAFPFSFLWLMRECARTVHVPIRDLYLEVVAIEKAHSQMVKSGKKCRNVRRNLI